MPNPSYQYSNGYDALLVLPKLAQRVMWKRDNPSKSGRYFDDGSFHSLVTEDNFRSIQPKAGISDGDFTTLRGDFVKAAVLKALGLVFMQPRLIGQPQTLFDVTTQELVAERPAQAFFGYEFRLAESYDTVVQLSHIVMHFNATTQATLKVYRQGESSTVWEHTLNVAGGRMETYELPDLFLSYGRERCNRFFIGFETAELASGAAPYRQEVPYYHCGSQYAFRPCHLSELPLLDRHTIYPHPPYGFNLEVVEMYDFTEKVLRTPSAFDELIGLCGAQMIVEQSLFTTRKNGTERQLQNETFDRMSAQLDLNGTIPASDGPIVEGLKGRIKREVARVQSIFNNPKNGIAYALYQD